MALGVNTDGSQSATVTTEHTLATITSANVFQLLVDVSAMTSASGTDDRVELREYMKARSGGTERLVKVYTLTGAQSELTVMTPPRVSAISIKYTLKQTQGTSRTFEWAVYQAQ